MAYFNQSNWQNQRKLVTQRIEPKLRPRRSMAVELLTVIYYRFYNPNASRYLLEKHSGFLLWVKGNPVQLRGFTIMKIKSMRSKSGFTLVEVLVSVGIMLVFLPFAAHMLTNSRLLASYSKHKIQAAYLAQQLIETQRQIISSYFIPTPLTAGQSKTINGFVMLDNKGNYTNTTCTNANIPCGIAVITVTPRVYNSNRDQRYQHNHRSFCGPDQLGRTDT